MKELLRAGEYVCYVLEEDDLETYVDAYIAVYADKAAHGDHDVTKEEAQTILDNVKKLRGSYLENVYKPPNHYFLLYREENGEKIFIGFTGLEVEEDKRASLFNSHILTPYRGHSLSKFLYEVRFKYLLEHTGVVDLSVSTAPGNRPSYNAALRNGFHYVMMHTPVVEWGPRFYFGRHLLDERHEFEKALQVQSREPENTRPEPM